jgi:tryptophan-rich sensory protein
MHRAGCRQALRLATFNAQGPSVIGWLDADVQSCLTRLPEFAWSMNRYLLLVVFLVLVALVALSAGQFMPGSWYAGLVKPAWTPPNWLFGPVWTVLYVMIAIAGWLAWQAPGALSARGLWLAQLAFNGMWSPVMFGWHNIDLALGIIAMMWLTIAAFIATSWRPARAAALLFVPYLAWVSYASALNFAVWRLNP